jgi:hypothetical protein
MSILSGKILEEAHNLRNLDVLVYDFVYAFLGMEGRTRKALIPLPSSHTSLGRTNGKVRAPPM